MSKKLFICSTIIFASLVLILLSLSVEYKRVSDENKKHVNNINSCVEALYEANNALENAYNHMEGYNGL